MIHLYTRLRSACRPLTLLALLWAGLIPAASAQWVEQNTNFPNEPEYVVKIKAVSNNVAWITGGDALGDTVYYDYSRTTDGGTTWTAGTVPVLSTAVPNTIVSLAPVSGSKAWAGVVDVANGGGQLYTTANGSSWTRVLPTAFDASDGGWVDAIGMFSATSGIIMGDPVGVTQTFEIYRTTDGTNWTRVPAANIPAADFSTEYGQYDCLVTQGTGNAWFGSTTGNVYYSTDAGLNWSVSATGLEFVSYLAFTSATNGLAVQQDRTTGNLGAVARTTDGGQTWTTFTPSGNLFGWAIAPIPGLAGAYLSAGSSDGGSGTSYSLDNGVTWTDMETDPRTAIGAGSSTAIWSGYIKAAGLSGGIYKGALPTTPPPVSADAIPNWVWARQLGASTDNDQVSATATDADGNVITGGGFNNTSVIGSQTYTSAGDYDAFIAKYSSTGTPLWTVTFGDVSTDRIYGVATDAAGNVYATGIIQGTVTVGSLTYSAHGRADAVTIKISSGGTPMWIRGGGSTNAASITRGYAIGVDASGNVYTTGAFSGDAIFDTETATNSHGNADVFLVSYTSSGTIRWLRSGGGASVELPTGLAVTATGVAITGTFGGVTNSSSPGGTATFSGSTLTSAGGSDGYIAHYSSAGTLQWSDSFGGTGNENSQGVAKDASGNLYAVGSHTGAVTFAGTTKTPPSNSSGALLLVSYTAGGTERWIQSGGGSTLDYGLGVTTDPTNNVYVSGYFQSTSVYDTTTVVSAGGADVLVVKYSSAGRVGWAKRAGGSGNDFGRALALNPHGDIFVGGDYISNTASFGTESLTHASGSGFGTSDGFLAKLSTDCSLATPTLSVSGPVCVGQTITLTGSGIASGTTSTITGPSGYSVATGSGTVSNATLAAGGTYTLTVTSSALNCSVTAQATAEVQDPQAPAAQSVRQCGPGQVRLTASGADGTLQWFTAPTGGTALPGASGNSYLTPALQGDATYYVGVQSSAGCQSPRTEVRVHIAPAPSISLTALGSTTFCQGDSVRLQYTHGTSSVTETVQFYRNGSVFTAADSAGVYIIKQAGQYRFIAANDSGCRDTTATVTVTVNATPNAQFTFASHVYCTGTATVVGPSLPGGNNQNTASFTVTPATGLQLSPTGGFTPSASQPGTYTLSRTVVTPLSCRATYSDTVRIEASPAAPTITATLVGGSMRLHSSADTGNQWYRGGSPIPGATDSTYVVTDLTGNGTYTLAVKVGPCLSAQSAPVVVTLAALAPAAARFGLTLAPNPVVNGRTQISLTGARTGHPVSLTLVDALGRTVYTQEVEATASTLSTHTLELGTLPAGVYTLRFTSSGQAGVRQVVIR